LEEEEEDSSGSGGSARVTELGARDPQYGVQAVHVVACCDGERPVLVFAVLVSSWPPGPAGGGPILGRDEGPTFPGNLPQGLDGVLQF